MYLITYQGLSSDRVIVDNLTAARKDKVLHDPV